MVDASLLKSSNMAVNLIRVSTQMHGDDINPQMMCTKELPTTTKTPSNDVSSTLPSQGGQASENLTLFKWS